MQSRRGTQAVCVLGAVKSHGGGRGRGGHKRGDGQRTLQLQFMEGLTLRATVSSRSPEREPLGGGGFSESSLPIWRQAVGFAVSRERDKPPL